MALTEEQKARVTRRMVRYYSKSLGLQPAAACPVTKAELAAAIDGACTGLENAQAALNTAIPQPARGSMATADKKVMLKLIMDEVAAAVVDFGE